MTHPGTWSTTGTTSVPVVPASIRPLASIRPYPALSRVPRFIGDLCAKNAL